MTDLDRLKQISTAAGTGLPPPTNEERRFLLWHLNRAYGAEGTWLEAANACRYTIPPKRCETCLGDGKVLRHPMAPEQVFDCPTCNGTGYQEAVT